MKHIKKLFAFAVTFVMAFALALPAFAATITVENAIEDETYDAYKLLEYTSDGDAFSYYLDTSNSNYAALRALLEGCDPAFSFTVSADGTQAFVNNSKDLEEKGADIAAYLYENLDTVKSIAIAKSEANVADADGKVTLDELDQGYWFVTSSLGSLCSLQSYDDEELVFEKNTLITDDKKVDADSKNAQVGDILNYTITLTDGKGTNLPATITDTLSKGLTFNNDAKASINGAAATAITPTVTPNADGSTKVVYTFDADTMTALEEGQTIVVTYTATVNDDASIDGTVSNTEYTEYSEQKTDGNTVESTLTDLTVNKTDGTDALKGAQFKLYRTDAKLNLTHVDVKLRQLTAEELAAEEITPAANTVYYTVDTEGTNLIDMAQKDGDDYKYSSAVVYGLDKDSIYYLEETKAPEGYNKLENEQEVALGTTTSVEVVNNAGSVLPSTGGIGTTIFYIVGGIMVVGAVVVLLAKRRAASTEE